MCETALYLKTPEPKPKITMLYDTYGEEYLAFLQELNEILTVNELAELDYLQLANNPKLVTMKNPNKENAAYLNFIQDLKDMLTDFDISLLSKQ